jgi:hypothetical protein
MVRAEAVEQAVRWVLSPMLTKDAPALLAHYRDADSIDYDAAARAAERARARLTAEQDRAERQLANLIDMRAAGEMTSDEYQAARARALSSRDQAAAALAALPEPSMTPMADPDATARLLGSLGALYHDPDAGMVQRRELLTLLGVAVTREPDGVWVRVAPAWRPWTRGDTFFPMVRAGLVVPSDAEGKPYAPERTIESDPIAAD